MLGHDGDVGGQAALDEGVRHVEPDDAGAVVHTVRSYSILKCTAVCSERDGTRLLTRGSRCCHWKPLRITTADNL